MLNICRFATDICFECVCYFNASVVLPHNFLYVVWPLKTNHITGAAYGPNATNILINLLPIVIFCEQRVILSQLLTFFIAISPGQPRTYLKADYFSLKCPNLFNVS